MQGDQTQYRDVVDQIILGPGTFRMQISPFSIQSGLAKGRHWHPAVVILEVTRHQFSLHWYMRSGYEPKWKL